MLSAVSTGGSFDIADRTFRRMATTWWLSSSESATDVKELIPEFFYLPEFLVNSESKCRHDWNPEHGDFFTNHKLIFLCNIYAYSIRTCSQLRATNCTGTYVYDCSGGASVVVKNCQMLYCHSINLQGLTMVSVRQVRGWTTCSFLSGPGRMPDSLCSSTDRYVHICSLVLCS